MHTYGTRPRLSRGELFAGGVRRGAALLVAGTTLGAFAQSAYADPLSDNDLAFARLLTGAELLAIDFYERAISAGRFAAVGTKYLENALSNETAHCQSVSAILSGAGYVPAAAADFEFLYPDGSFASRLSIARLGRSLESIFLSAYLGAVAAVQAQWLAQPFARIAASEAQHLGVWGYELGGRPLCLAFPSPFTIDQSSAAMDAYTA